MSENNKCEFCENIANYLLEPIDNQVECNYCDQIFETHSETHLLCDVVKHQDNFFIDNIKWGKKCAKTEGYDDKHECNECGRRLICDICFQIKYLNPALMKTKLESMCLCGKQMRYNLILQDNIKCIKCDHIKFKKGFELKLCSTKCEKSGFKSTEYLSKIGEPVSIIKFEFKSAKCWKCKDYKKEIGLFMSINKTDNI